MTQPTQKAGSDIAKRRDDLIAEVVRGIPDFTRYRERVAAIAELEYALTKVREIHHALFRQEDDAP